MAKIHCTQAEIANILGLSVDTLYRNPEFCDMYKKAQDEARASLRRMQWAKASEGNTTMLIWLGKQYLAQTDKVVESDEKVIAALDDILSAVGDKMKDGGSDGS